MGSEEQPSCWGKVLVGETTVPFLVIFSVANFS